MPSIFHYTKLQTLLEHILPSGKIKTNNLQLMNDPREALPWGFGDINLPMEKIFPEYYNEKTNIDCQFKFGKLIKDRLQIACFSGAVHNGWDNEMMWAHYGQNHAGVCLEFDEDILCKNVNELNLSSSYILEPIDYSSGDEEEKWIYWNESITYEDNIQQNISSMQKGLALTKSNFWEKEDEKRLVFLNTKEEIFIPIVGAIRAVYVGVKFDLSLLDNLESELSNFDAKLFRLIYERPHFKRWYLKRNEKGMIKSYNVDH